jgi:hypothetical protein
MSIRHATTAGIGEPLVDRLTRKSLLVGRALTGRRRQSPTPHRVGLAAL